MASKETLTVELPAISAEQALQLLLARQEEVSDGHDGPGEAGCFICTAERDAITALRAALEESGKEER